MEKECSNELDLGFGIKILDQAIESHFRMLEYEHLLLVEHFNEERFAKA
jgi:hypothetical protein